MIRIRCPHCRAQTNVSDDLVGKYALCGACEQPILISRVAQPSHRQTEEGRRHRRPVSNQTIRASRPDLVIVDERPGPRWQPRYRWWVGLALLGIVAFVAYAAFDWQQIIAHGFREPYAAHQEHVTSCRHQLSQIVIALHSYHEDYGCFPPPYIADNNGAPMHSWRVLVLEYLEPSVYKQYRFDEPWNSEHNLRLVRNNPQCAKWFRCPENQEIYGSSQTTNYLAVVGEGCVFEPGRTNSLVEIQDARSTILVVEAAGSDVFWMEPRDLELERLPPAVNASYQGDAISSFHGRFAHVALANGQILQFTDRVDYAVIRNGLLRSYPSGSR